MSRTPKRSALRRRVLFTVTAAMHVPFALAAAEAARLLALPHPAAVGPPRGRSASSGVLARRAQALSRSAALALDTAPRRRAVLRALVRGARSAIPIAVYTVVQVRGAARARASPEPPTTFALGAYLVFFAIAAWGVFVRRRWVLTRELNVEIPGLPREFDGYRVAQL